MKAVYLCSDSPVAITPGALCREFMLSATTVADPQLRVVMEGASGASTRRESQLDMLYPYMSVLTRLVWQTTLVSTVKSEVERGKPIPQIS